MNSDNNIACSNGQSIAGYALLGVTTRQSTDVELLKKIATNEEQDKKREKVKTHLKEMMKTLEQKNKKYNDMIKELNKLNNEMREFERMNLEEAYAHVIKNDTSDVWDIGINMFEKMYYSYYVPSKR